MTPTPTASGLAFRCADFEALPAALDYAARGATGLNFHGARGELIAVLPYRELRERALTLARGLVRAGLPAGARILLIADTRPDFAVLFFACQYAGLIPVPVELPTSMGGQNSYVAGLRRKLRNCGAALATGPDGLLPYLNEAAAGLGVTVAAAAELFGLPEAGAALRPFTADDPCYLQYSSGSTRFPHGVDVRQRSLAANAFAIANFGLEIGAADRCASWLPLYHDMGLVGFMLAPVMTQRSVDYLPTWDFGRRPLIWLSLLACNGGTLSFSPTFGYDLCTRRVTGGATLDLDLRAWRIAGIGGDMIRQGVLARFAEAFAPSGFRPSAFVPSYGMAEATLAVSFGGLSARVQVDRVLREPLAADALAQPAGADADGGAVREFVVCGKPLPGLEVEIHDAENRVLPERRLGRIRIKGPSVAAGYFGDPDATAATFRDGWLDTGDVGYRLDGALVITGRSKDLIIINGRNIWPQDLEWAVEELPGVRRGDAAAFSIEAADGGEKVVLLLQCRSSDPGAREQLVHEAKRVIYETAGVDGEVVLAPPHSLPMTSSGKLSRARARAGFLAGDYGDANEGSPAVAGGPRAGAAPAGIGD